MLWPHCIVYSLYCRILVFLRHNFVTTELVPPQDEESARILGVLDADE